MRYNIQSGLLSQFNIQCNNVRQQHQTNIHTKANMFMIPHAYRSLLLTTTRPNWVIGENYKYTWKRRYSGNIKAWLLLLLTFSSHSHTLRWIRNCVEIKLPIWNDPIGHISMYEWFRNKHILGVLTSMYRIHVKQSAKIIN